MVAVVGISSSSRADLLAQLDQLGTNLLQVQPGNDAFGQTVNLPASAPGMIRRIAPVQSAAATRTVAATVRRTDKIPSGQSGGIAVVATEPQLLDTIGGRLSAFNKQLADTITLLSNSLRAGSSFLQSIELVSRETPDPMGEEMGRVVREVNLGLGMEEALSNLVRRIRSDDLDLMVTAIGVQQQVGGNLAEILDTIAFTIRERVRIKGEINTLTAQGRYSGYLVAFLPIGIMITLNFINPEFMQPLFTQLLGQILLGVGAVMMIIGFIAIQKITNIKV